MAGEASLQSLSPLACVLPVKSSLHRLSSFCMSTSKSLSSYKDTSHTGLRSHPTPVQPARN